MVTELGAKSLLSDDRFTETYVHHRIERGYGPYRIRQELAQRGVAAEAVDEALDHAGVDWQEQVQLVRAKKFGAEIPRDRREQARQSRFLQQRGFSADQIRRVFRSRD